MLMLTFPQCRERISIAETIHETHIRYSTLVNLGIFVVATILVADNTVRVFKYMYFHKLLLNDHNNKSDINVNVVTQKWW
jgi:heme/copper-type cytochrome/quinol oxidase subunit 2